MEAHADLELSLLVGPDVDAIHSGVRGRYLEQLAHLPPSTLNRHRTHLLGRHARPVKRGEDYVLRKVGVVLHQKRVTESWRKKLLEKKKLEYTQREWAPPLLPSGGQI